MFIIFQKYLITFFHHFLTFLKEKATFLLTILTTTKWWSFDHHFPPSLVITKKESDNVLPSSTVLNLFHRAVIFYFLLFRSFYLIKLLIFIRKLKINWIAKFEILIKRPASPNKARRELIPNRSLRARLLSRIDCAFAFPRLGNSQASAILTGRERAPERVLGSNPWAPGDYENWEGTLKKLGGHNINLGDTNGQN